MNKYVRREVKFENTESTETKHVLLCGDKDYIKRCGVTLTSVILSNPEITFTFHIVCDDITDNDLQKIKETFIKYNSNIVVYLLDSKIIESLENSVNLQSGISVATFFRIIGFEILCHKIKTVLYLDSDILVCGSVKDFLSIELKEKYAVAIRDILEQELKDAISVEKYFNAGVLIVNLEKWKEKNLTQVCIRNIVQEKYKWMDQDALNVVFADKVFFVNKKYNFLLSLEKRGFDYYKDNVSIIHFVGRSKPWCSWVQDMQIVKEYMEVQKQSLWSDNTLHTPENEKDKKYRYKYTRLALCFAWKYKKYKECLSLTIKYFKYKICYKLNLE